MSNYHGSAYWCDQYHQLEAKSEARILELEQRVKVLTDALNEIRTFPRRRMPADIANKALADIPPLPKENKE